MRLLLALILLGTATVAQDVDRYDRAVPRHAIKFSPGHLLVNHHPTIEFSYEQRIARRWTLQGEYGHIVNIRQEDGDGRHDNAWDSDRKGYKAKAEARYYVLASARGRFTCYTAGELYYNKFNYLKQIDTWDNYETSRQRVYHEEKGFSGKFGFVYNMGPILLDVNGGLCSRFIHSSKLLPIFDRDKPFLQIGPGEKSGNTMGLVLGVRVGYRFPWRGATTQS